MTERTFCECYTEGEEPSLIVRLTGKGRVYTCNRCKKLYLPNDGLKDATATFQEAVEQASDSSNSDSA